MIDYQEIIENLSEEKVKNLLKTLDIEYEDRGEYLIMPTVCHHMDSDDASWKLYFYKNSKLFVCWTECGNMSIFTFLKNFYEVRGIEYNWYTDIYKVVLDCSNYKKKSDKDYYKSVRDRYKGKELKELPEYDRGVLDCFVKSYPVEWIREGISKETMDKYNVRYSISQNKIIIPHYDVKGRLVGIRGRALNPEEIELIGKYAPIHMENQWYSHPLSLNLYGFNFNCDNIKNNGICFLAEGEKSVLLAESFNRPNCCVAVCGSNFNKWALKILMSNAHPLEIVICFDKENEKNDDAYFNKLWNICDKYKNYCNFSFIYDRDNLLELKDSPFDKGEEVFEELLKRRVRVK